VYAICTKDGKTRYGRSGFVQIIDLRTFVISELDMQWRDTPFPTPRFVNVKADNPVLGLARPNHAGAGNKISANAVGVPCL
jgi:hypothetical protein